MQYSYIASGKNQKIQVYYEPKDKSGKVVLDFRRHGQWPLTSRKDLKASSSVKHRVCYNYLCNRSVRISP